MAQVTPVQIIAAGRVLDDGGVWIVSSPGWIRGASPTIAHPGAGIATITLDDPADPGTATLPGTVTVVTPVATANGFWATTSRPSDTTIQVNLWSVTNVASDISFEFVVFQTSTTIGA